MAQKNEQNEILLSFFEEADDHLQEIGDILLNWENQGDDIDDESSVKLRRALHTLKGSARLVGLDGISRLCHIMESLLSSYRSQGIEPALAVGLLLEGNDMIVNAITSMREAGSASEPRAEIETLLSKLSLFIEEDDLETNDEEDAFTWNPDDYADMLDDFLQEADEVMDRLGEDFIQLEQSPTAEVIDRIFRAVHTLKGSSGMISLTPINELAHQMETVLDKVRQGEHSVDAPLIDLYLRCLDRLHEMLQSVHQRQTPTQPYKELLEQLTTLQEGGTLRTEPTEMTPRTKGSAEAGTITKQEGVAAQSAGAPQTSRSLRVDIRKLDRVINLIGEFVIIRIRVQQRMANLANLSEQILQLLDADLSEKFELVVSELKLGLEEVTRISADLQEAVMRTRMVPIAQVLNRFPRLVRDLSRSLNKEIQLTLRGKETELDKGLVEALADPLLHIIRNAADHGIESPEVRKASGKPATGLIEIGAFYEGDRVVIQIRDDGKGIDLDKVASVALERGLVSEADLATMSEKQIQNLIFRPGFSTANKVTDTSGRGVGMDVVRDTITDLKGSIEVESSAGKGTVIQLRLPLTLAIIQVLVVVVGDERYALPLSSVCETITISGDEIEYIGEREVIMLRGTVISLLRMNDIFECDGKARNSQRNTFSVVIAEEGDRRIGILVDAFDGKQEIVIKTLGSMLHKVPYIMGATIMGDGRVVLIADLPRILQDADSLGSRQISSRKEEPSPLREPQESKTGKRILLVDDSRTYRLAIRNTLVRNGYSVTEAASGEEGLELLRTAEPFELIISDIMMPGIDGYELVRRLREMNSYYDVPVVLISTKDQRADKVKGFEAGADEYLVKPVDDEVLLRMVRDLLNE